MAAAKKQTIKCRVRLGVLGWSYLYYPDDKAPDGATWKPDGKYKTLTVYEPGQLDELIALIKTTATAHFAGKEIDWDDFKFPYEVHAEDSPRENWRNKVVLTAKTKFQPNVYDAKNVRLSPVLDGAGNPVLVDGKPAKPKVKAGSGDIVNIIVYLVPWEKTEEQTIVEGKTKKKVSVTARGCALRLKGVQLIEKRSGGYTSDFDEEDGFSAGDMSSGPSDAPVDTTDDGDGDF